MARPSHFINKHKQFEQKQREAQKQQRIEKLAEIEAKYQIAIANSNNPELVAQYNHFLAVRKDYENMPTGANAQFNAEKAIQEINNLISDFRVQNIGVDSRDLESLKFQLNMLKSLTQQKTTDAPTNEQQEL